MTKCSINDCQNPLYAKTFCNKHWRSNHLYGNPLVVIKCGRKNTGFIHTSGYKAHKINGEFILDHREIMEKHLGRKLLPFPEEIVHHIDGNRINNNISNLTVMSGKEHGELHHNKTIYTGENKSCSMCSIIKPFSEYYKHKSHNLGLRSECKSCISIANRKYRNK